jgi:uncharacterized protein (DUF362 family)
MNARVAIVDDSAMSPSEKLAAALERAGFWEVMAGSRGDARIVIKPDMAGFTTNSPCVTDPALVEVVIDLLHDHGFSNAAVVGTVDSSSLWADNRDLYALADLLGYRFTTRKERSYDIVDLGDAADRTVFPSNSILHGGGLSRDWLDADVRIVFAKNRTDEATGYALCLDGLIGVLPQVDKDLHYRRRRHVGDVVAALLDVAPVQFCLIDGVISAHGVGGKRAPEQIETGTIIAASDAVLADYVGALKMGLDPVVSPIFERVARGRPLPRHYTISGSLTPYAEWSNVPEPALRTTRMRQQAEALARLVEPWLQQLDPELFPLKHPLDARMNATLAGFFADSSWLLVAVNALVGFLGQAVESYRTPFDKDALRQQSVPLGIDTAALADDEFEALVDELTALEPIALAAPKVSDELRWRYVEKAVVFSYTRCLPIDFDLFVQRVDVARTIQFMNDYIGGVLVPLSFDEAGRPVRQAERNIYLPQPNYLVLYQGKPIDVSKLEVVEYAAERHRLFWKTIGSENGSASYDDGIATFERTDEGTLVTIVGRQQFTLPLFWQVFDLDLLPDLKSMLVTHAYQTFFDRTLANLEALVEGRDIRIGRAVDEATPLPVEQLMPVLQKIGEIALPLLEQIVKPASPDAVGADGWVDGDGFTHVSPVAGANVDATKQWGAEVARFFEGFRRAAGRDLLRTE